ncbi:MAG: hypothetical protein HYR94_28675 [Chloroflexi bacterium]|nr:hypothetical protein [Chloroflexota bacterium]
MSDLADPQGSQAGRRVAGLPGKWSERQIVTANLFLRGKYYLSQTFLGLLSLSGYGPPNGPDLDD